MTFRSYLLLGICSRLPVPSAVHLHLLQSAEYSSVASLTEPLLRLRLFRSYQSGLCIAVNLRNNQSVEPQ